MKSTFKNRIAYILALIILCQHIFYVLHVLHDHQDYKSKFVTTFDDHNANISHDSYCYICDYYLHQNLKSDLISSVFIIYHKLYIKEVLIPTDILLYFTPFTSLRAPPSSF